MTLSITPHGLLIFGLALLVLLILTIGVKLMAAIDDLTAAVNAQTAGVQAAVAAINTLKGSSGTPDSVLAPIAATIQQNNATLAAALPVAPAPAPAPAP